jgi:hypothetical protein
MRVCTTRNSVLTHSSRAINVSGFCLRTKYRNFVDFILTTRELVHLVLCRYPSLSTSQPRVSPGPRVGVCDGALGPVAFRPRCGVDAALSSLPTLLVDLPFRGPAICGRGGRGATRGATRGAVRCGCGEAIPVSFLLFVRVRFQIDLLRVLHRKKKKEKRKKKGPRLPCARSKSVTLYARLLYQSPVGSTCNS